MLMKHSLILSLAILLLAPFLAFGQGQDLLKLYPENYKVIMENDRVRGLDFRLRKGAKENSHDHPAQPKPATFNMTFISRRPRKTSSCG